MSTYEQRVRALEAEGLTRSDAQGVVDAEDLKAQRQGTHTPGPWRVVHTADDRTFIDTEEGSDNFIAQIDRNWPGYEGHASIIAAAPELLELLKEVAELRRKWESQDEEETIDSIAYMDGLMELPLDEIIAKAEGRA